MIRATTVHGRGSRARDGASFPKPFRARRARGSSGVRRVTRGSQNASAASSADAWSTTSPLKKRSWKYATAAWSSSASVDVGRPRATVQVLKV
eukprot:5448368-Pyramimonas_sp.AAC.1